MVADTSSQNFVGLPKALDDRLGGLVPVEHYRFTIEVAEGAVGPEDVRDLTTYKVDF